MAHFGMHKKGLDRFMLAVASGRTVRAAAKAADISERTARRHAAEPAVQLRIDLLRGQIVKRGAGRVIAGMTAASRELMRLLRDPSPKVRLAAARAILDFGARLGPDDETITKDQFFMVLRIVRDSLQRRVTDQQALMAIENDIDRAVREADAKI
jgi:hypothetical protein